MRILFIAPHIFYRARGSSLGVYYRAKALGNIGHKVDVLCYHLGDVLPPESKNVRIIRAPKVPCSKKVDAGPSYSKIILDASLFTKTIAQILRKKYDVIHTTEEASLLGALLRSATGLPHVYNVHSIMSTQLEDFNFSKSKRLARLFDKMQHFILNRTDVVVTVSGNLTKIIRKIHPKATVMTIEDTAILKDEPKPSPKKIKQLRKELKLEGKRVILYTGSFFKIQNLELVLECAPKVVKELPNVRFVFVGGSPEEVADMNTKAKKLGIEKNVIVLEKRPLKDMPSFYQLGDILISPRAIGINATLKVYQYLNSGKPVLATDCPVHTQQVQEPAAALVPPEKDAWSDAIIRILRDKRLSDELGRNGKHLIQTKYSYARFEQLMNDSMLIAKNRKRTRRQHPAEQRMLER